MISIGCASQHAGWLKTNTLEKTKLHTLKRNTTIQANSQTEISKNTIYIMIVTISNHKYNNNHKSPEGVPHPISSS